MAANSSLLYKDRPIFGLDIGFNTIKVMQTSMSGKKITVNGYGIASFDSEAIKDGEIVDIEKLAHACFELFDKNVIGTINTRRVAVTIPASRAYSRLMTLPAKLNKKQLAEAIQIEAEQYIPLPPDELYMDYTIAGQQGDDREVLVVAVPKKIIDSYMKFFAVVGLEVCLIETTIAAASRMIAEAENTEDIPTILIDLGSLSVDLTIYDKTLIVNGTVPGGGDDFTNLIASKLKVSKGEANTIKTKYGLGVSKKQAEIREALKPQLEDLAREVRRVVRYYEERTEGKNKIGQIITMGGGANMPGLADYLTDTLRIPTRMCNFWGDLELHKLQPPADAERSVYVTVAGLAVIKPAEIWK
jgi:type IV pilus assembly protein PilM